MNIQRLLKCLLTYTVLGLLAEAVSADSIEKDFPTVVKEVATSTLAIAVDAPLKHANPRIIGTGFAVGNGNYAVTNYHVVSEVLDPTIVEDYVVLSGEGQRVKKIKATVESIDPQHDLALLKLSSAVTPLTLANDNLLPAGSEVAFTGFPVGAILGLYPATHRGYISAITPDAIPVIGADQLTSKMMKRLAESSLIYQLDAVAYPGNSGSPVFDPKTGAVIGVINKVLVRDTRESALSSPTGISYAVPVTYVHKIMNDSKTNNKND